MSGAGTRAFRLPKASTSAGAASASCCAASAVSTRSSIWPTTDQKSGRSVAARSQRLAHGLDALERQLGRPALEKGEAKARR